MGHRHCDCMTYPAAQVIVPIMPMSRGELEVQLQRFKERCPCGTLHAGNVRCDCICHPPASQIPPLLGHEYRARRAWDGGPVDDACFELVTDLTIPGGRAFCLLPEGAH